MYDKLGDLLPDALGRLKVKRPVEASKVCEVVTKTLAEQWDHAVPMRAVTYQDLTGLVTVAVTSSAWAHEVTTNAEPIKAAANKKLRRPVVKKIKTRVAPKVARGERY